MRDNSSMYCLATTTTSVTEINKTTIYLLLLHVIVIVHLSCWLTRSSRICWLTLLLIWAVGTVGTTVTHFHPGDARPPVAAHEVLWCTGRKGVNLSREELIFSLHKAVSSLWKSIQTRPLFLWNSPTVSPCHPLVCWIRELLLPLPRDHHWTHLGFYTGKNSCFHQIHQGSLFLHHTADFERYTVMNLDRELKEWCKSMRKWGQETPLFHQ